MNLTLLLMMCPKLWIKIASIHQPKPKSSHLLIVSEARLSKSNMKRSNLLLLSVAFLLLSGMVTAEAAHAEPSEPTTEMKVPVSPMPRQSSERFSSPATFAPPHSQSNDRPLCFYQRSDTTIVDLSKLCGAKSTEPVQMLNWRTLPLTRPAPPFIGRKIRIWSDTPVR